MLDNVSKKLIALNHYPFTLQYDGEYYVVDTNEVWTWLGGETSFTWHGTGYRLIIRNHRNTVDSVEEALVIIRLERMGVLLCRW